MSTRYCVGRAAAPTPSHVLQLGVPMHAVAAMEPRPMRPVPLPLVSKPAGQAVHVSPLALAAVWYWPIGQAACTQLKPWAVGQHHRCALFTGCGLGG